MQHCINGAMIKAIVTEAIMNALQNDIDNNRQGNGVTLEDFNRAVEKVYLEQKGLNHTHDLADFAESIGIQVRDMKVDRCFSL